MKSNFFERLRNYYLEVAGVLRGEAGAASIFPNPTDIGMSREKAYCEFLNQHVPSKCNIFFGGFIFGENGDESGQLDVIVTTDTTPRFNLHNKDGSGKSFSSVNGCLAVVSIKSMLNKNELEDSLKGLACIPATSPLDGLINPALKIQDYDDWPYKVIYATNGISAETLLDHINNFYQLHPDIPLSRRPNIIHVCGKYVIVRADCKVRIFDKNQNTDQKLDIGNFYSLTTDPDLQGIMWVLDNLQERATISSHIIYSYGTIIKKVNKIESPIR